MAKTDDAKTNQDAVEQDPKNSTAAKVGGKEQDLTVSGDRDSTPARGKAQAQNERGAESSTLREDMPTNDEPDISFTANAEEVFSEPVQVPPAALAPLEVVEAPRRPDPVHVGLNRRVLTEEDTNSPGFKMLSSHAQDNAEVLVLRPGDRVVGGIEVVGMNNPDRRMELRPGAVVPEGDIGYLPTNYIRDHQRQRIMQQDAERAAGNRP